MNPHNGGRCEESRQRSHPENSPNRSQVETTRNEGSWNNHENHVNADMEDLKKKYEELKLANKEEKSVAEDMVDNTNLPFTNRVLGFPLPDKFKKPHTDKYNNDGDPSEQMENPCQHFFLHETPDEIACRTFPLTLSRVAKDWFMRLLAKSIDNFKDLGRLFLAQFLSTRKIEKNPAYLLSFCQGKDEILKDFMLKFNRKKLNVKSPHDQIVTFGFVAQSQIRWAPNGQTCKKYNFRNF